MISNIEGLKDKEDEIDLLELLNIIWDGKWFVFASILILSILGLVYAMSLPNIYRAEALLSPANNDNAGGGQLISNQLGGLASLAGVNLGSNQSNQTVKAIATIKSRSFIKSFFNKHDLLISFMAVRPSKSNKYVEIDPELYDVESKRWVREVSASVPSDWEVYKEFNEIFNVNQNDETGLIKISIEWYDPIQIKQWIDWLVEDLNSHMKEKERIETSKGIDYLQKQLEKTSLVEMKHVFYSLIEAQTQKAMLADIKDEYSFEQIDEAVVPEEKSSPKRALIIVLASFLGGVLGVLFILVRFFLKNSRTQNN